MGDDAAAPSIDDSKVVVVQNEHGVERFAHCDEHGYKVEGVKSDDGVPGI